MSALPLVRVEGVTKRFGAQAAVDGVDLDIREGEFFVSVSFPVVDSIDPPRNDIDRQGSARGNILFWEVSLRRHVSLVRVESVDHRQDRFDLFIADAIGGDGREFVVHDPRVDENDSSNLDAADRGARDRGWSVLF